MNIKAEHYKQMLKYWDFQSEIFAAIKKKRQITNKILKLIEEKKCKNILEIGCGTAEDTVSIVQGNERKVTCVDFSSKMIKKAKNYIRERDLEKQVSFILSNILEIKLKKELFDGIIAKSVLHHLFSKNDIITVCKKIYRSLKEKGIFILVENWSNPNPSRYENMVFQISQKARDLKGIKELFLNKNEYIMILKKNGFSNIEWTFIDEDININRYAMNKDLEAEVRKIKLAFPRGKVKTLFIVAYKN